MPANESPMGLALIACDLIIHDKQTNKRSLIGLFDQLFTRKLPCIHPALAVFVSLTSGRGKYPCEVRCRHQQTGEVVFSARGDVTFSDPMRVVELVFNFQGVRFNHEGEHWLECIIDEVPVMMRRIAIVKRQPRPKPEK